MVSFCCLKNCKSSRRKDKKLSFFRIPSIISVNNRKYRCTYTTQTYRASDFITANADYLIKLSVKRQKAWEDAIKRGNLTKSQLSNYRVCAKHFISGHPADLLDETNPDWIPSQNLDSRKEDVLNSSLDLDKRNKGMPKCKSRKCLSTAEENSGKQKMPNKRFSDSECLKPRKRKKVKNEIEKEETESNFSLKEELALNDENSFSSVDDISDLIQNLFDTIYENEKSVELPMSWHRIPISWDYRRGITFSKIIGKKGPNNRIDSLCQKEIIIDEDMSFTVKINAEIINQKHLGIEGDVLISITSLENVINLLENV